MMAPGWIDNDVTEIFTGTWYYTNPYGCQQVKVESKQDKIDRIAKERMLASRKMFHMHTPTIPKIIHRCKPHHRIHY